MTDKIKKTPELDPFFLQGPRQSNTYFHQRFLSTSPLHPSRNTTAAEPHVASIQLHASPLAATPLLPFHHITGSTTAVVAKSTQHATPSPHTAFVWKHSALPLPAHPVNPITALPSPPEASAMANAQADSAELAAEALRIARQFRWLIGRPRRTETMVKARRRRTSRAVRIRRVVEAEE